MTLRNIKLKEHDDHTVYVPEVEPASLNGTPIEMLPLPEPGRIEKPEKVGIGRAIGRGIKNGVKAVADMCFDAVDYLAERLSTPLWRAIGTTTKKLIKLGFCMWLDFLDFFIGRLLGFGIVFDLGCALMCAALWGKRGWWCLVEVLDVTEQIDGFVPSCTLIALRSWNDE